MPVPEITLLMTAHAEGRLAHRSLKSALGAIERAREQGIGVEFVAVLDAPTAETADYFEAHRDRFDTCVHVNFGDVGLARNEGVRRARGRYVAFTDADDLVGPGWLRAAHAYAQALPDESFVLRPAVGVHFGGETFIYTQVDSLSSEFVPLNLIPYHYWVASSAFCPRSVLLNGHWFTPIDLARGFGYEDWHWSCETLADGVAHRVVPETVVFVRVKEPAKSLGRQTAAAGAVFRRTRLFDDGSAELWENPGESPRRPGRMLAAAAQRAKNALRGVRSRHPYFSELIRRMNRVVQHLRGLPQVARNVLARRKGSMHLPAWLLCEWKAAGKVEPELTPSPTALAEYEFRRCPTSTVVRLFPELSRAFGPRPTHVFLLPWLKRGGADIGAMHFMNAVARESADNSVVCVTTEDTDSPWADRLPPGVRVIDLGSMLRGFLDEDRLLVLNRTLIQKQPAVIHNINSPLGYDLFERHGRSLAAGSRLFASAFCEDLSPEVKRGGPAFERLPRCIDDLSAVLCDNRAFPSRLIGIYDFPPGKVMTVYFPAPPQAPRPEGDHRGPELRVLWASRLDWQKRPDVLLEVASACSGMPVVFHVYGESVLDPAGKRYKRRLAGRRNVILHGAYDGFESIPAREHDVFLYTSQSDGLPNVLLEAMATGLPAIAPLVGGIGELVTEDTGFPVSGPDAVGEYVGRLREVLADRSLAGPRVRAATELLRERHSRKAFVARLREVPGYLSGASPAEEKQG